MAHKRLRPGTGINEEILAYLREIIPEAFADGKLDWAALSDTLGTAEPSGVEVEHFGLTWPGKSEARRIAATASHATLLPAPGEGVAEGSTRNLFIEGDNLEVLKLLQKSYIGGVKMIYIDPPYNTGNDFIYEDDFAEPLDVYLRRTKQLDEEGAQLTTNTRADGRFHSKWLSMMYPRIRLARNLLSANGVMFVSIDDNELPRLRQVMDELFGEENFIGQFVVQLNPRGRHLDRFVARTHEYVVAYARDAQEQPLYAVEKDERMAGEYNKRDERGAYRELELRNRNPAFNKSTRPNLYYPVFVNDKDGSVSAIRTAQHQIAVFPRNSSGEDSCWTWGKAKLNEDAGICAARQMTDGTWRVFRKDYLIRSDGTTATTLPKSLWTDKEINNDYGKKAVQELFDGETLFDFPKSPDLIKKLIEIGTKSNGIVMDFFAGSGTTADAVMSLNAKDGGSRQFICVQLPQPIKKVVHKKVVFNTIAEITKERLRRKAKALSKASNASPQDLGFRVLKLSASHFRPWSDYTGDNINRVIELFAKAENPLLENWTPAGLLTEVMLLEGFPLDSSVSTAGSTKNHLSVVESDSSGHKLIACFDPRIHADLLSTIELNSTDVFVCLDSALSDEVKLKLADRCQLRTI